jgi:hypothetical protein
MEQGFKCPCLEPGGGTVANLLSSVDCPSISSCTNFKSLKMTFYFLPFGKAQVLQQWKQQAKRKHRKRRRQLLAWGKAQSSGAA